MKRLLAFLALVTVAHGAGSVQQSIQQLGQTNNWVLAFTWTGDASNGTVPNTAGQGLNCCTGYLVVQVETTPGSPSPTAGYGVAIQDSSGVDVLNGAAASLSASASQSFAASTAAPPLQGILTLVITGQNVASAKGTVYVFLSKPGSINVATLGRGATASTANWVTLANPPFADARTYNFTPQSPGGSLSIGANTITLTPCPLGLNGTDAAHNIYLSGGSGTAEAVLITGGTCVSNAASGTVTFTAVNTHSGSWAVSSATGGLAEAVQALGTGATIFVSSLSPVTVHATTTLPTGSHFVFSGTATDVNTPSVIRASDFSTGDIFFYTGTQSTPASLGFIHFGFTNGTSTGIAIHMVTGNFGADGLYCTGGVFIAEDSVNNTQIVNFAYFDSQPSFALSHAILLSGPTGPVHASTNGRLAVGYVLGQWLGAGIEITGADTWDIDTVVVAGPQTLILIDPPSGGTQYVTNLRIHGGKMDAGNASSTNTEGIKFIAQSTSIIGSVVINDVDFLGYAVAAEAFAIDLSQAAAGYLSDIKISGCHIFNWNVGIAVGQTGFGGNRSIIIAGNTVVASLTSGITLNTPTNETIVGNTITGNAAWGINVTTGAVTNTLIADNKLDNNTSGPITGIQSSGATSSVLARNIGIDNVVPAIASAAAFNFPLNPDFTITGTTGVTSVGTFIGVGQSGTFITTAGAVAFTAGATIGNSCTTTQNKPYSWFFDGTKVWINGSGC